MANDFFAGRNSRMNCTRILEKNIDKIRLQRL